MDLSGLFFPESIAVVGASPGMGGGKAPYYLMLKSNGFAGPVYPVNPKHKEINGEPVYPTLADLPHKVDFVIASVPARFALETLKEHRVLDQSGQVRSESITFLEINP